MTSPSDYTADPSADSSADPLANPLADSAEPLADPSADSAAEPLADSAAEPLADPSADPSADSAADPSASEPAGPSAVSIRLDKRYLEERCCLLLGVVQRFLEVRDPNLPSTHREYLLFLSGIAPALPVKSLFELDVGAPLDLFLLRLTDIAQLRHVIRNNPHARVSQDAFNACRNDEFRARCENLVSRKLQMSSVTQLFMYLQAHPELTPEPIPDECSGLDLLIDHFMHRGGTILRDTVMRRRSMNLPVGVVH